MSQSVVILRSNPVKPDPRVEKEARALYRAGYTVTVVAWDRGNEAIGSEVAEYGEVHRIYIPALFNSELKNIMHLLKWQVRLLLWLVKNGRKYSIIHACDFDTVIPAYLCSKIYNNKIIYDIFDFYADMLRKTPNNIKEWIKKTDQWFIKRIDAVILADESRIRQVGLNSEDKVTIIMNSPESIVEEKIKTDILIKPIKVVYFGLIQEERGIFEIIDIIKNDEFLSLDIGGYGGDEIKLLERIKDVPNIFWHGKVSYEKVLEYTKKANVLFATYNPSIENHRYSSPNKLFEAAMFGKPIIVARNTGVDILVKKYNLGFVIDYGNVNDLEGVFTEIKKWGMAQWEEQSKRSKSIYECHFSWEIMKVRLLALYEEVLCKC